LRPQVHLIQGRMFRPSAREIIVGNKIAQNFAGTSLGEKLHLGLGEWTVVGIFDANNTAFDSEIWGDVDQLMQAFRRNAYSSVLFKLADPSAFELAKYQLEHNQRLTVEVKRETKFYAEQSEMMSQFLNILGLSLS